MLTVSQGNRSQYPQIVELWESSVRATHHFLTEEAIQSIKGSIATQYLPALNVYVAIDEHGQLHGVLGTDEYKLEMLFISADSRGQGCGKLLLNFAIQELKIDTLDVNEQNPQAVGFYQHMGFVVIGRSEFDGQGEPYPLLHMKLLANDLDKDISL